MTTGQQPADGFASGGPSAGAVSSAHDAVAATGAPAPVRGLETGSQGAGSPAGLAGAGRRRWKWVIGIGGGLAVLAAAALIWYLNWGPAGVPALVLEKPAAISAQDRDEIVVDVRLTNLPEGVYPGASLAVEFDRGKLECVGVRQGTMKTLGGAGGFSIPIWSVDADYANREGRVNAMYLDQTGETWAYAPDGFAKGDADILLRLVFRLRDSAQAGDELDLRVKDAVLATTDNALRGSSLATADRTLRAFHTTVEVAD